MKPDGSQKAVRIAGADVAILARSDSVQLVCGPEGCPSTCCKNGPPVVLNAYEVARICAAGRISYEDLLDIIETERVQGVPLVLLPRDPECPFWTEAGCSVYEGRPLACRLFPLGRVFENNGSHIVLPDRNRCNGLVMEPRSTVAEYLRDQETSVYIEMADHWIDFVSAMERLPLPDRAVTSVAFHIMVYDPAAPVAGREVGSSSSLEQQVTDRLTAAQRELPRFLPIA